MSTSKKNNPKKRAGGAGSSQTRGGLSFRDAEYSMISADIAAEKADAKKVRESRSKRASGEVSSDWTTEPATPARPTRALGEVVEPLSPRASPRSTKGMRKPVFDNSSVTSIKPRSASKPKIVGGGRTGGNGAPQVAMHKAKLARERRSSKADSSPASRRHLDRELEAMQTDLREHARQLASKGSKKATAISSDSSTESGLESVDDSSSNASDGDGEHDQNPGRDSGEDEDDHGNDRNDSNNGGSDGGSELDDGLEEVDNVRHEDVARRCRGDAHDGEAEWDREEEDDADEGEGDWELEDEATNSAALDKFVMNLELPATGSVAKDAKNKCKRLPDRLRERFPVPTGRRTQQFSSIESAAAVAACCAASSDEVVETSQKGPSLHKTVNMCFLYSHAPPAHAHPEVEGRGQEGEGGRGKPDAEGQPALDGQQQSPDHRVRRRQQNGRQQSHQGHRGGEAGVADHAAADGEPSVRHVVRRRHP